MRRKFVLIALIAVVFSALAILVGCSGAKSLFGPTQLATPDNISYDGSNITWSSVENATKYSVSINDGAALSVRSAVYTYNNTTNTQFTVSIIAKADDTESYEDSETATHTFIPVDSVTDVTVAEDGSISWTAVSNVSGYYVSVDGETQVVYTNSFSGLAAGTHTVMVKPYVEVENTAETVDYTYYSVWSSSETITICEDVDADTIKYSTLTGQISWGSVAGATGYEVTITSDYETKTEIVNTSSYTYDAQKGNFSVSVKAVGSHTASYDSVNTTTKKFAYLETATNLRVEDGILYWNEVEGATGYYIKINGTTQGSTVEATQYSGFSANMSYTINIMPTCDDTVYFSAWTADYSFNILSAPTLQWVDMGLDGDAEKCIIWDGVDGAEGYMVRITTPSGITETTTKGSEARSVEYDFLETGTYTVEVKATASETDSNRKDSLYSSTITVTRLAAPQFISNNYITSDPNKLSQGFTVTFGTVTNATQYAIYKDGVFTKNITGTQYSDSDLTTLSTITQQTISYKIQSVGGSYNSSSRSIVLSSLSANSLEFNITILATPDVDSEPINGYIFSYSSVSGASDYCVSISGVANVNGNTSYSLETLSSGSHTVSVCARGNGADTLASNYTAEITVVRLVAPTDVYVRTDESDGMLQFTEVAHAQSYRAIIDEQDLQFPVNSGSSISGYISTTGTTMHFQTVADYFDSGIYYMTSPEGATYTFCKLAAPSNITFTGSQLTWNAPSNVNSYTPTYVVYTAQGLTQTVSTGTSVSTSWLTGGTSYTIYIKAIGDREQYNNVQYINSDNSISVTAYKLASPDIDITSNAYSWYAVTNATSYAIYIDGVLSDTEYHYSGTVYTYTPYFSTIETHSVQIYAIGGAGETMTYIDSEATQINQEVVQLQTPEYSVSYSKECVSTDGEIVVTVTKESPYATGYYYYIGSEHFSEETTYSLNTNTAGSIEVRVYAAGGGFDENGTYYVTSQSTRTDIYLLGTPTSIDANTDGYISWGAVDHASKYDLTVEFTDKDGTSYTYTAECTSTGCDWYNIYKETGVAFSNVYELKVYVTAKGTSSCVPSQAGYKEWTL